MNWRLTSELIAYVLNDKKVFLAATEKKQYQTEVLKLVNSAPYQEVRLYENQFELKFDGDENSFDLYLRCNELNPEEWFKVSNFYKPGLWNLMENHIIENGVIKIGEGKFEAIFEEKIPYVSFIEPNMKNFKDCFEEMKRKMNCELCKKTSKWIPGHRYDSFTESVFPLCTVKLTKTSLTNSQYIKNFSEMPEVIIYVNELDNETKISEVLNNRSFGNKPEDLKIAFKPKLLVDAGEILENDFSGDIKNYWLSIYNNAKANKKSLKEILDTFSVTSDTPYVPDLPEELINITQKTIEKVLINCWDLNNVRADLIVNDNNSLENNIDRAKKLFIIDGIQDVNFLKGLYYPELYTHLGINLSETAEKAIVNVSTLKMTTNFDTYLKYIDYWKNPNRVDTEKCYSKQRIKSTKYKLDVITLKDIFGETSELKDELIKEINHVRENFGLGASEYTIVNAGTKKDPKEYIICRITIEDLIKYKKGTSNISETLKDEILKNHFVWIQVVFDKDGILT